MDWAERFVNKEQKVIKISNHLASKSAHLVGMTHQSSCGGTCLAAPAWLPGNARAESLGCPHLPDLASGQVQTLQKAGDGRMLLASGLPRECVRSTECSPQTAASTASTQGQCHCKGDKNIA
eukprot:1159355-Pelagomonas_calceolata.AAC.5